MAQAKEGHAGATGVVDDYDAICRVLERERSHGHGAD